MREAAPRAAGAVVLEQEVTAKISDQRPGRGRLLQRQPRAVQHLRRVIPPGADRHQRAAARTADREPDGRRDAASRRRRRPRCRCSWSASRVARRSRSWPGTIPGIRRRRARRRRSWGSGVRTPASGESAAASPRGGDEDHSRLGTGRRAKAARIRSYVVVAREPAGQRDLSTPGMPIGSRPR